MKDKKEWETESLQWIHDVRLEIDSEITKSGMTPSEWIKSRGEVKVERLCKKLGLKNYTIIKKVSKI